MARGDAMRQRFGGISGSFSAQIGNFAATATEKVDAIFRDIVVEIGESVIMLSPVDTGRFKGNWQLTSGAPSSQSLINYDKQGLRTLEKLVNDANKLDASQRAYIVNNLVYSIPLEYGYSQQAPSGVVRVTLARLQQIISDAVRANQ